MANVTRWRRDLPAAARMRARSLHMHYIGRGSVPSVDHHGRRLHRGGGPCSLHQPQLLDGVAGDRGRDQMRARLDLHQGHDPGDLHGRDRPREPVSRRERVLGSVAGGRTPKALDLARGYLPAVARVARRAELPRPVPAPQRVHAYPDRPCGVAHAEVRHCGQYGSGPICLCKAIGVTGRSREADDLASSRDRAQPRPEEEPMQISARNKLPGQVKNVTQGEAIANVELDANGMRIVASVTVEAVRELGIEPGKDVTAVIKASDVMLAVD